jgi:diguanylate cyclase (GGDEF)-like protein
MRNSHYRIINAVTGPKPHPVMKHLSYTITDLEGFRTFLSSPEVQSVHDESQSVLAQLFIAGTDPERFKQLSGMVAECIPKAVVVGASTIGEVIDGDTVTGQTVLGLTFFSKSSVIPVSVSCLPGKERNAGCELAQKINQSEVDVVGVLLLATPLSMDMATFFRGLESDGRSYPVFGGGAGDYAAMQHSTLLCGDEIISSGAVGLVLSGTDLEIDGWTYLGWHPLSKEMTITKVDGLVVKTVDDMPAFELYNRYLGIENDENFFLNTLEFPFLLNREGEVLARVPIGVDAEGGLQFVADIAEGETFRIGYGDPNLIISDAKNIHDRAHAFSPQVIFLYTCGCRRFLMQEDVELETKPFETFAPTFGFYTYGEFFGKSDPVRLLNSTMVAVCLREGNKKGAATSNRDEKNTEASSHDPYANKHARIISRLIHFVEAVTGELEDANKEILALSETDQLTNVANRMKLDTVLVDTKNYAQRYDQPFSIIMLDIDHFKQVNDTHGHLVGDKVLVGIADVLKGMIRDIDTLGRWGGEEFLLILPHTDIEQAQLVAEKLREAIAGAFLPVVGRKTASLGVATYLPTDSLTDILDRADSALYKAKKSGRNHVCLSLENDPKA